MHATLPRRLSAIQAVLHVAGGELCRLEINLGLSSSATMQIFWGVTPEVRRDVISPHLAAIVEEIHPARSRKYTPRAHYEPFCGRPPRGSSTCPLGCVGAALSSGLAPLRPSPAAQRAG